MTRIYLIRHAEAEGNLYRRAQGHWDGKITDFGRRQIDALAERFRDLEIDALYSSDLSRTVETARAVTRYHAVPLITTPRLREIHMGVWEGESWGDLSYRYPQQMNFFNNDPARWQAEGGEPFADVQRRMTDYVLETAAGHDGQTVVLVSHGMAIRAFLMAAMGVPSAEAGTLPHGDNTSVSLLEVTGNRIDVLFYNDNSHLGTELSTFARQSWWREKGEDVSSLRFAPLLLDSAGVRCYADCYGDAWRAAHGSEKGFVPKLYVAAARGHAVQSPQSLVRVLTGDGSFAGILELDPRRGEEAGYGWISLCYLRPEYRGKGLGVQLIGYAAAYFSDRSRHSVRLHAASTNARALRFYKHYGFREIGVDPGVASDQFLLEKEL